MAPTGFIAGADIGNYRVSIPCRKMEAYTVEKGFQDALDPRMQHEYPDLPAIVC